MSLFNRINERQADVSVFKLKLSQYRIAKCFGGDACSV
jgi:hypothetical protein